MHICPKICQDFNNNNSTVIENKSYNYINIEIIKLGIIKKDGKIILFYFLISFYHY